MLDKSGQFIVHPYSDAPLDPVIWRRAPRPHMDAENFSISMPRRGLYFFSGYIPISSANVLMEDSGGFMNCKMHQRIATAMSPWTLRETVAG